MMKLLAVVPALYSILITCQAAAVATPVHVDSKHIDLKSADNFPIHVEYGIQPVCEIVVSDGTTHNVRYAGPVVLSTSTAQASDVITVEAEFWGQRSDRAGHSGPILRLHQHYDRTVQMQVAGGVLSADLGKVAIRDDFPQSRESWTVFQTLRIVVNARPLIDPVSGTDRFQIWMDDGGACQFAP